VTSGVLVATFVDGCEGVETGMGFGLCACWPVELEIATCAVGGAVDEACVVEADATPSSKMERDCCTRVD
jgi:hypothetical protein